MYLLKLAFRPWRLAFLSQIFSAFAVGLLLFLIGFLFWMQYGLKSVLVRLQAEQVITAYIDTQFPQGEEEKLLDTVRNILDSSRGIEVKLVSSRQFIDLIKQTYPNLGRELDQLGNEANQIVPRYISITGMLSHGTLEKVRAISGIESAESSKDRYHQIVAAFTTLRWVARILMGGLFFSLLIGLIHLTRTNSYLHEDALSILRFWGAGRIILMGPGIFSGLLVGLLGGVIASGGWLTLGLVLSRHIRSLSVLLKTLPALNSHLSIALLIMGCGMGFLAGAFGSLSIRVNSINGGGAEA